MNKKRLFKIRTVVVDSALIPKFEQTQAQCPICKRWFNYYGEDYRGVKLHIRKWAGKEALAYYLGEVKSAQHTDFWKEYTERNRDPEASYTGEPIIITIPLTEYEKGYNQCRLDILKELGGGDK